MLPALLPWSALFCLGTALLLTGRQRAAGAVWAGSLGLSCWLWPAFLSWQTRHPDGQIGAFLTAHGLTASLLTVLALLVAAVLWTLSSLTACVTLPAAPALRGLLFTSQGSLLLLPVALGLSEPRALPLCFALWSSRLAASLYFAALYRHWPLRRPLWPSRQEIGISAALVLWLTVLAGHAVLWPTAPKSSCDPGRVLRLRQEHLRARITVLHEEMYRDSGLGVERGLAAPSDGTEDWYGQTN